MLLRAIQVLLVFPKIFFAPIILPILYIINGEVPDREEYFSWPSDSGD